MKNTYDASEILKNLKRCSIHDRQMELICTSQTCKKPRMGCTKCFYDKSHKECKPLTLLIEDLCQEQFNESIESWINNENSRKELTKLTEIFPGDLEIYSDEISQLISEKFEKIKNILLNKLTNLEKNVQQIIKEKITKNQTMNLFQNHYYLKTLTKLIKKNCEQDNNSEFIKFFDYDLNHFLEQYHNEKEFIYFKKNNYIDFLDNRNKIFDNMLVALEENLLSLNYFNMLFVPPTDLLTVKRFNKYGNSWGYVKNKLDCISFKTNKPILFHGCGILNPLKQNEKLLINLKILEGESNDSVVLYEENIEIIQKNNEIVGKFNCEPILIKEEKVYSICMKIEGEDSYNGCEGEEVVEGSNDLVFNFLETVIIENNKNNNTNVNHGQIPEIYYSLISI